MTSTDGFAYQASCHRICGTYRREQVDHVPLLSPIPWQPQNDIDATAFSDWRDEERFRRAARLVQKYCDPKPPYNRVSIPRVHSTRRSSIPPRATSSGYTRRTRAS
jgi:hypothetical protein